jgi:magnesium chelatase family protein
MLVQTNGGALLGVDALPIRIEVNTAPGIKYQIVGLPDNAIKESEHRIRAALRNVGYRMPGFRITINLSPADLKKEGAQYDLPIALGILAASEQIRSEALDNWLIMGELALNGDLNPLKGALPLALLARKLNLKGVILPRSNAREAAVVPGLKVYGLGTLREVIDFLEGKRQLEPEPSIDFKKQIVVRGSHLDFNEVKGQRVVKRALEVAAAGGHNILMVGPPGSGKTMMAKRLAGILPPLSMTEAIETTKIHSVAGRLPGGVGLITERPFRAPHHTISDVALVGGGTFPQPGEISLAHNGLLFLDELPEFKRTVLEVMRQPLEDKRVHISRARFSVDYPASFMLVASMNPSPSGDFYDPSNPKGSSLHEVQRYLARLSGPLLDRIDLQIEVKAVSFQSLSKKENPESSADIRRRVIDAREQQLERFKRYPHIHCNALMGPREIQRFCALGDDTQKLLKQAMEKLNLSARAYDRILKVARTISDLSAEEHIGVASISEAIMYRSLDRKMSLT